LFVCLFVDAFIYFFVTPLFWITILATLGIPLSYLAFLPFICPFILVTSV